MGASWNGRKSGTFGKAACFSTQTYKHMNSGEGGLLTTDDPELIAQAILYSGSYMLFERHTSRPETHIFDKYKKHVPNYSCRMDNLRASLLRPQLKNLDKQCERWNKRYRLLESELNKIPGIVCPRRPELEYYVGSSIQFSIVGQDKATIQKFLKTTSKRGVELKWFGNSEPVGFTSAYSSWQYFEEIPRLDKTDAILATMCDMRIPLTFNLDDCRCIAEIIAEAVEEIFCSK
jgi:dTDP-4-amino-4,6-dideoxygalactose transaminase